MTYIFSSFLAALMALSTFLAVPALAAGTSDGSSATAAASYAEAKAMVDEGNFVAALPNLIALTKADAKNADAWNLLGFTYRKLGQLEDSDAAYLTVLSINPDHLGALEYQGELFITTGKLDEAKANLAKLHALCGDCEQAEDLAKALKAAGA
jgi:Flp pilus assembly protein TadD